MLMARASTKLQDTVFTVSENVSNVNIMLMARASTKLQDTVFTCFDTYHQIASL